jgi:beta-glucosidase
MAIEQGGADAYMTAYNAVNGIPMAASPLLKSLTMKQWGFNGMIDTDRGALTFMVTEHKYYSDMADAAAGAIHASSAQGALQRLRTLVMRGLGQMTAADIDREIQSSIHLVAHIHRQNGERSVQDILRVSPESQAGRDDAAGNGIFPCRSI